MSTSRYSLHAIVESGDYQRLCELFKTSTSIEIDALDEDNVTALNIAVSKGNSDIVKFLLEQKANPVKKGSKESPHSTPLDTLACTPTNDRAVMAITQLLLDAKANVEEKNEHGFTALQVAINNKNIAMVTIIFKTELGKISSTSPDLSTNSNLGKAFEYLDSIGYIKIFIDQSLQKNLTVPIDIIINHLLKSQQTTQAINTLEHIIVSATKWGHATIVKKLIDHKISITPLLSTHQQVNLFSIAVQFKQHDIITLLLENKANPNLTLTLGEHELSPLCYAISSGDAKLVNLLLKSKAQPAPMEKQELLHIAATHPDPFLRQLLIAYKELAPFANYKDREGITPLHVAAIHGNKDAILSLIENKANIKELTNDGKPTAYCAIASKNHAVVELLLEKKSTIFTPGKKLLSPFHYATTVLIKNNKGRLLESEASLLDSLLAAKTDINSIDENGRTALHLAAEANQTEIVQWLLKNKADIDKKNRSHRTPIALTVEKLHPDLTQLLLDAKAKTTFIEPVPSNLISNLLGNDEHKKEKAKIIFSQLIGANSQNAQEFLGEFLSRSYDDSDDIIPMIQQLLKAKANLNQTIESTKENGFPVYLLTIIGHRFNGNWQEPYRDLIYNIARLKANLDLRDSKGVKFIDHAKKQISREAISVLNDALARVARSTIASMTHPRLGARSIWSKAKLKTIKDTQVLGIIANMAGKKKPPRSQ